MLAHVAKVAMIDSVTDCQDTVDHVRDIYMSCAIGGAVERYHEFLERGMTGAEVVELLFVQEFGPRPAKPPFPDLIDRPEPWREKG